MEEIRTYARVEGRRGAEAGGFIQGAGEGGGGRERWIEASRRGGVVVVILLILKSGMKRDGSDDRDRSKW